MYDVDIDGRRPVTQADVDLMQTCVAAYGRLRENVLKELETNLALAQGKEPWDIYNRCGRENCPAATR
jgi:hypothetical protein